MPLESLRFYSIAFPRSDHRCLDPKGIAAISRWALRKQRPPEKIEVFFEHPGRDASHASMTALLAPRRGACLYI